MNEIEKEQVKNIRSHIISIMRELENPYGYTQGRLSYVLSLLEELTQSETNTEHK